MLSSRRLATGFVALGLAAAASGVTTIEGAGAQLAQPTDTSAVFVIEYADLATDVAPQDLADLVELLESSPDTGALRSATDQAALTAAAVGGQITVSYMDQTPSDVRQIVERAVSDWNQVLSIPAGAPIVVEFHWEVLGNGLLGAAGPTAMIRNEGGLPTSDLYPLALANVLSGTDLRPTMPEIQVTLAANLYNIAGGWYAGFDSPPASQRDLYSTVVHELAHGLGFIGSSTGSNGGTPQLRSTPFSYDRLARYNGSSLVGSGHVADGLTSDNLKINIGGEQLRDLYAPTSYQPGSSFSHFDEDYSQGEAGSMMSPALSRGEADRNIDAAILGVMDGIGWPLEVESVTPILQSIVPSTNGLTATWSIDLTQRALPPVSFALTASGDGAASASTQAGAAATSATLGGLDNFKDYEVSVTGFAGNGTSASTTAQTSGNPRLLKAAGSGLSRTLSWQAITSPGANNVVYTLRRSKDGGAFQTIGSTSQLSLTDSTLSPGVYQYTVTGSIASASSIEARSQFIGVTTTAVRPFALDGQVARLFEAYLDRTPDAGGMSYWLGRRATGESLADLSAHFEASSEFQQKFGNLSNNEFVQLVYSSVVGRAPDAAGLSYWVSQLDAGMSRGTLMIGFSEGPEFITLTNTVAPTSSAESALYRLYVAYFLRAPDSEGFNYWLTQANAGVSLSTISEHFASGAEFKNRYGSLDNEHFVSLVYANVLTREAEGSGTTYWVDELDAGASRGYVMVGFANSTEFLLATGTLP